MLKVTFEWIAILRTVLELESSDMPVFKRRRFVIAVNTDEWTKREGIGVEYRTPFFTTRKNVVTGIVRKMVGAGLLIEITRPKTKFPYYEVSKKGKKLLEQYGTDWRNWPVEFIYDPDTATVSGERFYKPS